MDEPAAATQPVGSALLPTAVARATPELLEHVKAKFGAILDGI